jgi:molybdopterin/thiamine biosynthesis adenylyltransferase
VNDLDTAFSRPIAAAEHLAEHAKDAHNFIHKRLLICGEPEVLASENGRVSCIVALLLAVRTVQSVDLYLPTESPFIGRLRSLAETVALHDPAQFLSSPPRLSDYDAVLNVGFHADSVIGVTAIVSSGWIAHVSSIRPIVALVPLIPNAVGAVVATCLGFSDVFKRLVGVRPDRASYFDQLSFSTYSNSLTQINDGPDLPVEIALSRTLIAGCGAIGNGTALTTALLPTAGTISTLDNQDYRRENYGTSALLAPTGFGMRKAVCLGKAIERLNPRLTVTPIPRPIERYKVDDEKNRPQLILAGFDKISARHALDDIGAEIIIDGGIDEFGVQLSSWRRGGGAGCLKCQFVEDPTELPWEIASRLTGLSVVRAMNQDDIVKMSDVDIAPEAMKPFLRERLGRTICSVVSERTMQELAPGTEPGFAPSVPWVATLCGALVVAQGVRASILEPGYCPSRVSFDALTGPESIAEWDERPRDRCRCKAVPC